MKTRIKKIGINLEVRKCDEQRNENEMKEEIGTCDKWKMVKCDERGGEM